MDEENSRKLFVFHNNLFAAERAIAIGNGQPDPAPPADPPLPNPNPLTSYDNLRTCLRLLDNERLTSYLEGSAEGAAKEEILINVVRSSSLKKVHRRYQDMYDQAFQSQLDPNVPGSVASEVNRILKKKQEHKKVQDRMHKLEPTDIGADDFIGTMIPNLDFEFELPNLADLGIALDEPKLPTISPIVRPIVPPTAPSIVSPTITPAIPEYRNEVPAELKSYPSASKSTIDQQDARHEPIQPVPQNHFERPASQFPRVHAQPPPFQPQTESKPIPNRYGQLLKSVPKTSLHLQPGLTSITLHGMSSRYQATNLHHINTDAPGRNPRKRSYDEDAVDAGRPERNMRRRMYDEEALNDPPRRNARKRRREEDFSEDEDESDDSSGPRGGGFVSATHKMHEDNLKKYGQQPPKSSASENKGKSNGVLGKRPKLPKYIPPLLTGVGSDGDDSKSKSTTKKDAAKPIDERLKNVEPRFVEMIKNEIISEVAKVTWDQIAGLDHAKSTIMESVVWPTLKPEIFKGLLTPPKGLLLFGPPGTGKTLIGKCIASEANATFFSISASSLASKWVGEGEKMVKALFAVARVEQPSVIFVDEIDSMLSQRTEGEADHHRKIKTEFLEQRTDLKKLMKRLVAGFGRSCTYIPLPEASARKAIIVHLLKDTAHELSEDDVDDIVQRTDGYSGSDVDNLCREAALGPLRDIKNFAEVSSSSDIRPMKKDDFLDALTQVRASVGAKDLEGYMKFEQEYGSITRR
ncbi:hypothetical protein HK097_010467 [Rhizophlyctis rosea]|uniref:AAA+ ATPase domain-containing protein n=1 Tax=Rhizophlyctis rosea TaxID=64517 RepID=A0AAD5S943_9FUNG|nr:hypothetical protein HK097_010467 [Rhizophlyctis rosea]